MFWEVCPPIELPLSVPAARPPPSPLPAPNHAPTPPMSHQRWQQSCPQPKVPYTLEGQALLLRPPFEPPFSAPTAQVNSLASSPPPSPLPPPNMPPPHLHATAAHKSPAPNPMPIAECRRRRFSPIQASFSCPHCPGKSLASSLPPPCFQPCARSTYI